MTNYIPSTSYPVININDNPIVIYIDIFVDNIMGQTGQQDYNDRVNAWIAIDPINNTAANFVWQPATPVQIAAWNAQNQALDDEQDLISAKQLAIEQVTIICNNYNIIAIIDDFSASTNLPITNQTDRNGNILTTLSSAPDIAPLDETSYLVGSAPTGGWSSFPVGSIATYQASTASWINSAANPTVYQLQATAIDLIVLQELENAISNQAMGQAAGYPPYQCSWDIQPTEAVDPSQIGINMLNILFPYANSSYTLSPGQVSINAQKLYQYIHSAVVDTIRNNTGIIANVLVNENAVLQTIITQINAQTTTTAVNNLMASNWQSALAVGTISKLALCQACSYYNDEFSEPILNLTNQNINHNLNKLYANVKYVDVNNILISYNGSNGVQIRYIDQNNLNILCTTPITGTIICD